MRADTVDWVTFILRAASMKLRVSATIKKVRARFTSIVRDRLQACVETYLSKFPIGVTGNFRLWMRLILTKLACPDGVEAIRHVPGRAHNGRTNHDEGEKESGEEACGEESCEEEEEIVIS